MTPLCRSWLSKGFQPILEQIKSFSYIFVFLGHFLVMRSQFHLCGITVSPGMYWRPPLRWLRHPWLGLSCSSTYWRWTGQKPPEQCPQLWTGCCWQRKWRRNMYSKEEAALVTWWSWPNIERNWYFATSKLGGGVKYWNLTSNLVVAVEVQAAELGM